MTLVHNFTIALFKAMTRPICRIDQAELQKVPSQGPLLIVTNHINVLEIPIIYSCLQPRRVHGMVDAERWKNPLFRYFLDVCASIPVRRGESDLTAIRRAISYLDQGHQILIMPEGTRSGDGRMLPGHPGMVLLAQHNRTPLLPVIFYGGEAYKENLSRLKRTDFHIRVGRPFCLEGGAGRFPRHRRQQMADEIMYQLAALLPEKYRGVYANLSLATQEFISWLPGPSAAPGSP